VIGPGLAFDGEVQAFGLEVGERVGDGLALHLHQPLLHQPEAGAAGAEALGE
jgi:hypothetical protein